MLRLISKGPNDFYRYVAEESFEQKQNVNPNLPFGSFLSGVKEISPRLWVLRACDTVHKLDCELFLERADCDDDLFLPGGDLFGENLFSPSIFCDFPCIDSQQLRDKVGGDADLDGLAMIGFQLQILEQLLLIGEEKGVDNLILNFGEHTLDFLEIYRSFLILEEEVMTARGEQTQITIPVEVITYDQLLDLMDKVERDFQQALWRGQKTNPALRHYIKSQVVSRI